MILILVYILGCFFGALYLRRRGCRRDTSALLGACALVCVLYLAIDKLPLPVFSISSFWTGEKGTSFSRPTVLPLELSPVQVPAAPQSIRSSVHTIISAGFSEVRRLGDSPLAARIGGLLYLVGAAAILVQPRYGLYLILLFTLLGDAALLPWYPFVKGFSGRESLFFLHDAIIVSPLELYVLLIAISWLFREARHGRVRLFTGDLFRPALAFMAFLLFGLVYGIGTGGDLRIALWEARAIFYLIALLVLTSNLTETAAQANRVIWMAMAALFIKGTIGSLYYLLVLKGDLTGVERISEHAAAMHLNTLFVLGLAAWIYKTSVTKRAVLPLMIPFVMLGYIAMQRRAAFVTLAVAFVLAVAVLYRERRRAFWLAVPGLAVLSAVYLAVFWNSQSVLAVPSQAIKSVIAADQASSEDRSSTDYRVIENRNVRFTVQQHPLTGVGFGRKFYMIEPLPDISARFDWWEYITHDSVMWIWMKTGVGGFFSLLFLMGLAVMRGAQALQRRPGDDFSAVLLTATLYIVMHFIYACADMSWDAQSAVYVGAMMGLVNRAGRIMPAPGAEAAASATPAAEKPGIAIRLFLLFCLVLITAGSSLKAVHRPRADEAPTGFRRGLMTITFDDGYESQYRIALPLLQKHGLPATFYLTSSFLDTPRYMSTRQALAVKEKGHEIGSHTVTHPHLTTLSAAAIEYETEKSKDALEELFGPINAFASPFGEYDNRVLEKLGSHYSSHRTVNDGFNSKHNFDVHGIKVQNIRVTTTTDEVIGWLERARQEKTWLVLVYHQVDEAGESFSVTPRNFGSHLSQIKRSGIHVATMDRALAEIAPQVSDAAGRR
jgi:hypothetical protein